VGKKIVNLLTNETAEHQQILSFIDEANMTSRQYWLWLMASGGTLLDGISVMIIGITLHILSKKLSPVMMGLIGAALVFGAVVGSNLGGELGDSKGRKKLLTANMLIIAIGAVLSLVSFSPWVLFTGQLIIGSGIGSDFAVGGAYVAEIIPRKKRSQLMVGTIAFQSLGLLLAGVLAWFVMELNPTLSGVYRYLFGIETILALVFFFLRFLLIESPRWLMGKGYNKEAAQVIATIYPQKQKELSQLGEAAGEEIHRVVLPLKNNPSSEYKLLFSKEYIKRTILASVPWFLMDITTYGVGLFTPVILSSIMKQTSFTNVRADAIHVVLGTTGIDLFLLLGFIAALWLVPKIGRIRMQEMGFAGMFIGMITLFLTSVLNVAGMWYTILIFGGFIVFNLFMNAGPNATTFTMAPELFPTQLRSTAGGFAAGIAKIGATLGIFVFPTMKHNFGVPLVLAGVALISLSALLITVIYSKKINEGVALEGHHR